VRLSHKGAGLMIRITPFPVAVMIGRH